MYSDKMILKIAKVIKFKILKTRNFKLTIYRIRY